MDPVEVADYYEVIPHPMDLSTVKRKLEVPPLPRSLSLPNHIFEGFVVSIVHCIIHQSIVVVLVSW